VTFAGDRVSVDWTGSSAQVEGGINSPLPFTKACAYTALRSILPADIPNCHGYTRAIDTVAPSGTIMNPVLPAPCGARGITGYRMIDCLFGALAAAVPQRVTADGSGGSTLPTISGWQNGVPFVFCETFMGNAGATADHDGQDGAPHLGANQCNVPVEMIEATYPLRIEQYGLVGDTGGPGRHRGGLSLVREYRVLAETAELNIRSDKRKHPAHGLFGGREGAPSLSVINPGSEDRIVPVMLTVPERLRRGDVLRHTLPGAGGYGDPLDRDPALVLKDVVAEKVSLERAASDYGVVVKDGAPPRVDEASTLALRARLRSAASRASA
jgi:N-methylhydantoinase B